MKGTLGSWVPTSGEQEDLESEATWSSAWGCSVDLGSVCLRKF